MRTLLSGEYDERGRRRHDPRRRRWCRRRRLRRDAACACTCAGPSGTSYPTRCSTPPTPRRPGLKSATFEVDVPYAFGNLSRRGRHPPPRADQPVRQPGPPPDQLRRRRGRPAHRADRHHRDPRERAQDRRLPLQRPRRPVGQHHRLGGAHDAPPDRHRRVDAEREEPDPEPRRRPARAAVAAAAAQARPRRPPSARSSPATSRPAGASRCAPTCCTRTRWSRTCAPSYEVGNTSRRLRRRHRRLHRGRHPVADRPGQGAPPRRAEP